MRIIKTPVQAPRPKAIAERWAGSARRECLDQMLISGQRHLRLALSEYTDHYNSHRPHRSLQQEPPAGRAHPPAETPSMRVLAVLLAGEDSDSGVDCLAFGRVEVTAYAR